MLAGCQAEVAKAPNAERGPCLRTCRSQARLDFCCYEICIFLNDRLTTLMTLTLTFDNIELYHGLRQNFDILYNHIQALALSALVITSRTKFQVQFGVHIFRRLNRLVLFRARWPKVPVIDVVPT